MDKELCRKCIYAQHSEEHTNSVCEVCYQVESKGNGNNSYFIKKINVPNCCGECAYCVKSPRNIFIKEKEYCKASQKFDKDEKNIVLQYVRKNYLTKGTPKWCPLKNS